MATPSFAQLQSETAECGIACLAICSTILGAEISMAELRAKAHGSTRGSTLSEISEIAGVLNLQCRAVKCEPEHLRDLSTPAILHWKMDHFVVLTKVKKSSFDLIDPSVGKISVSKSEF